MSKGDSVSPAETGKVLGSIYGSLIILFAVLFFLSTIFSTLTTDAAMRSFYLMFLVGGFIVLIGVELARVLLKSGITIVGFFGFLALNLLMVIFGLAVFVDIVVPTVTDATIQMVIYLLLASVAWYAILIIWTIWDWRKKQ